MAIHLRILSWALIFLLPLRFPPGKSIAKILVSIGGNLFKQILDKHAPLKQIQLQTNVLPWITHQFQKEIRRNRLYKKYRKNNEECARINYKYQRNRDILLRNFGRN